MNVDFPAKLRPLFSPARMKDIRGGRDAGKSWGAAQALIEIASASEQQRKAWGLWCPDNQANAGTDRGIERIVCCRENMNSIADSVYQLLEDTLRRLQLESMWKTEKQGWKNHRTGAEFIFRGLRNPDALKSLEGASRAWIEEAQSMSAASWRKVPPTVRRRNSELWFTWNPELETDPTYKELVVSPDPGCIHIILNYTDNPWSSSVLDAKREQMRRDDPDEFDHVYMGQPRRAIAGAVYAAELRLAQEQGRITRVPHTRGLPVYTGWDLGDGDFTAIWFVQAIAGQYRFINYYEDCHKPMIHYLAHLETLRAQHGYQYATAFFPWDAASKVLVNSFEENMRRDGLEVKVGLRQSREVGIDKVREMLGSSYYDEQNCADGLNRMRYYRYGFTTAIDPATGRHVTTREPLHDDNSHGSDAARTFAMGYRAPKPAVVPTAERRPSRPVSAWS